MKHFLLKREKELGKCVSYIRGIQIPLHKQLIRRISGGYFISFEGGEGVGKTTQIHALSDYLRQQNYEVIVTREPGGTAGAEAARHVLLDSAAFSTLFELVGDKGRFLESLLFTAARIDHLEKLIVPALTTGKVVLCDRFIDSSRVYQGCSGGMSEEYITLLEEIAVKGVRPNLTFILDLPASIGKMRIDARRKSESGIDRFEKAKLDIQEQRRQGFLLIAKREPERCHVLDGSASKETIADIIAKVSIQGITKKSDYLSRTGTGR